MSETPANPSPPTPDEPPKPEPLQPWDRQQGEGKKAYAAFLAYRDMGGERSLRKLARALNRSTQLIGGWSSAHHWVERVGQWDAELASRKLKTELAEAERMMKSWVHRSEEAAELELRVGAELVKKIQAMIALPLTQQRIERDGQTIVIEPLNWKLTDLREFMALAKDLFQRVDSKTERLLSLNQRYSILADIASNNMLSADSRVRAIEAYSRLSGDQAPEQHQITGPNGAALSVSIQPAVRKLTVGERVKELREARKRRLAFVDLAAEKKEEAKPPS